MKTALVCAFFLGNFVADGRELAPVAEITTGNGPAIGGVIVRAQTAPAPLVMLSPLAPPEYGSALGLVTYTDDPNRTANPNLRHTGQPSGIRLLTLRPNW